MTNPNNIYNFVLHGIKPLHVVHMKEKFIDLPLSVLDFVKDTEGMSKDELIIFGENLKLKLKDEPIAKGSELYPIGYEIDHLIHFIKQINWYLQTNVYPGALRNYDEILFSEVVSHYQ